MVLDFVRDEVESYHVSRIVNIWVLEGISRKNLMFAHQARVVSLAERRNTGVFAVAWLA